MKKYLKAREVQEMFGITRTTLQNWRITKRIKYFKVNAYHYLYDVSNFFENDQEKDKKVVIYCRVSNTKQKDDLNRQETLLREYAVKNGYKVDFVFKDIASGMNENRKDFNKMLKMIFDDEIDKVIISYKDRLTRFGFIYFENIFKNFNCEIDVVNLTKEEDFQTELTEDLISIIHYFSMKMYSNRRKQLKELKKKLETE